MTSWSLVYSRQAQKDAKKLRASGLKPRAQKLLEIIAEDPFATPPRFEKLVGDLAGCYSRRINIQHRLVYEVLPDEQVGHGHPLRIARPPVLARQAVEQMNLVAGRIGTTPLGGGSSVVGVPTLLWVVNPAENTTGYEVGELQALRGASK